MERDKPSSEIEPTVVIKHDLSLHQAAKEGCEDMVRELLERDKSQVNIADSNGYTAFHHAVENHRLNMMILLLHYGADSQAKLFSKYLGHYTAVHLVAGSSHNPGEQAIMDTLEFLVENQKLEVNDDSIEHCPLFIAGERGNKAAVSFLLDQKGIKLGLGVGDSILHKFCDFNDVVLVELLLKKLKEKCLLTHIITKKDSFGHTPLDRAFCLDNLEIVSKLLEHATIVQYAAIEPLRLVDCTQGEESPAFIEFLNSHNLKFISPQQSDGATVLHLVSKYGWVKSAEKIAINQPSLLNKQDKRGRTPLHYAADKNNCKIIEVLMKQEGCKVDAVDKSGYTPLLIAAKQGCCEAFAILLQKANPKRRNKEQKNAILLAAEADHCSILLEATEKKDIDQAIFGERDRFGNTPLHAAASQGCEKSVSILLDQHVDATAWNSENQTPLHLAAKKGHLNVAVTLLNRGPIVTAKDRHASMTPLHCAALGGDPDVMELFIRDNPDKVNEPDGNGKTPLHHAACQGHQKVVDSLISKHNADKNAEDDDDCTPLLRAVEHGHHCTVETLLRYKADLKKVDGKGRNALELAIDLGKVNVAKIIVEDPYWRSAMCHVYVKQNKETTPMRELIRQMPDIALRVLNRCTSEAQDASSEDCTDTSLRVLNRCTSEAKDASSEDYKVTFDYEFLEDLREPTGTKSQSANANARISSPSGLEAGCGMNNMTCQQPSHLFRRLVERFTKKPEDGLYTSWGPREFDTTQHTLKIMVENKRTEMLDHPLVSTLIAHKWKRAWYLYLANVLFYLVFVSFLTAYALVLPNSQSDICRAVFNGSVECLNATIAAYQCEQCGSNQALLYVAAAIVLLCTLVRMIMEFTQILEQPYHYVWNYENWLEVFLYSFTAIFMSSLGNTCVCPKPWQWQIGALAVFMAWIHLGIFVKKFPQLGLYVIMFETIVQTFIKIALPALLLVLAFSLSFYMMFFVPSALFSASAFATPGLSIIKGLTMAAGGGSFETIFRLTSGGVGDIDDVPTPIPYLGVSILLWIIFLILMSTLLGNLLTGVAVGDVQEIQCDAEYRKLELQINLALKTEEVFQAFQRWFIPTRKVIMPLGRGTILKREIITYPNRHKWRNRLLSLLFGVDTDLNGEDISSLLSNPIKTIKIKHVYEQLTSLHAIFDRQEKKQEKDTVKLTAMAMESKKITEQIKAEMADQRAEMAVLNERMETVLNLLKGRG